jgi:Flp pilus assembly protein TadG
MMSGDARARRCARRLASRVRRDERGSTIPLVLGFFLIGLMLTAGGVSASDAFAKHRDLQSACDGAALAGANAASTQSIHGSGVDGEAIPLQGADAAIHGYLARDPGTSDIQSTIQLSSTRDRVDLECTRRTRIAFGPMFGRPDGVVQKVEASARSPLTP